MENQYDDSAFEAYAREQERLAREGANRGSGAPTGGANYVDIKWTGLEDNRMKVIRAVGAPPNSDIDKTTAKTVRIATIKGDDGKNFRCILPDVADDPNYILWKIIARVEAVTWVNKQKTFPIEAKHPDIYYQVVKNGFRKGDRQFNFDKGWKGQQKLIMNVIDREMMDWHRENKHTALLSKNIGVSKTDGREFPEEGVPSYGFESQLANMFKYYKSWEKYDIGVVRTGIKENPYRVINASKYFEEVPEDLQPLVVSGPLTEEEASWERYDLSKLFQVTTANKLQNKLKLTIARIDMALGTHFADELKELAEAEKAKWEAEKAANPPVEEAVEAKPAPKPVRTEGKRAAPSKDTKAIDTSKLKGWDMLSDEQKAQVVGVEVDSNGAVVKMTFSGNEIEFACPECGILSPESFKECCPACGYVYPAMDDQS